MKGSFKHKIVMVKGKYTKKCTYIPTLYNTTTKFILLYCNIIKLYD